MEQPRPLAVRQPSDEAYLERRDLGYNERAQVRSARRLWDAVKGLKGATQHAMAAAIRMYINLHLDPSLNPADGLEFKDAMALHKARRDSMYEILRVATEWQRNTLARQAQENRRLQELDRLIDRVRRSIPQDIVPSAGYDVKDPAVAAKMLQDLEDAEARHGSGRR